MDIQKRESVLTPFLPAVAVILKIVFAFVVVIWLSSFVKVRAASSAESPVCFLNEH